MALSTYDDDKHNNGREIEKVEKVEHSNGAQGHADEQMHTSILDAIKANPKVLLYCILMTTGPLIFGYDSIIVGVSLAIPSFQ